MISRTSVDSKYKWKTKYSLYEPMFITNYDKILSLFAEQLWYALAYLGEEA